MTCLSQQTEFDSTQSYYVIKLLFVKWLFAKINDDQKYTPDVRVCTDNTLRENDNLSAAGLTESQNSKKLW